MHTQRGRKTFGKEPHWTQMNEWEHNELPLRIKVDLKGRFSENLTG